jgi:hypothetical protein
MIEKTLKTTTGKLRVKIPETLDEVTLGQMIDIQEKSSLSDLEAISILSGLAIDQLQNVNSIDDLQIFGDTVLSLSHQIQNLYNSDAIPKKITFSLSTTSITINVMNNLSVEPAGAFMASRDIIAEEINEHIQQFGKEDWEASFNPSLKACCQVLAHYFYCRATGKRYNEYEAEEFCIEIKKLRVTEALPIAKHFFTVYPGLSKQKTGFFRRCQQLWKRKPGSGPLRSLSTSTP